MYCHGSTISLQNKKSFIKNRRSATPALNHILYLCQLVCASVLHFPFVCALFCPVVHLLGWLCMRI